MKNSAPNQFTGYHAPDYRFRFHIRSISHRALFLPIGMKKHPKIIRLIKGETPLYVFNCQSIHEARQAFNQLRKRFDFAYWAISDYRIRHIDDADNIVPLCLNRYQHHIIDTMQKRHSLRKTSRYVITKSFPQYCVEDTVRNSPLLKITSFFYRAEAVAAGLCCEAPR